MAPQMSWPGKDVAAAAANHVNFAAHNLCWIKIDHIGDDLDYLAHELVSDQEGGWNGLTRPIIPLEDMHVRAADTGAPHADQNVIDADARDLDLFEPKARLRLGFDQRFHVPIEACKRSRDRREAVGVR